MNLWMGDDAYHGGAFMLQANHGFYAPFFVPQKNPLTKEPKIDFRVSDARCVCVLPEDGDAWGSGYEGRWNESVLSRPDREYDV